MGLQRKILESTDSVKLADTVIKLQKQLASVTKERDEWRQGARNLQCEHQKVSEELDELMEICVGLATGTDWNKGTHAEIYRPKLLAKVDADKWCDDCHSYTHKEGNPCYITTMTRKGENKMTKLEEVRKETK